MNRVLSAFFSAVLALAMVPAVAFAAPGVTQDGDNPLTAKEAPVLNENGNIAEGVWGTCPWEISADGTLTVHPGKGATPDTLYSDEKSPWIKYALNIEKVVFKAEGGKKIDLGYGPGLFNGLTMLKTIDFSGLDQSELILHDSMFRDCMSLASLDFSHFEKIRLSGRAHWIFRNCRSLTSLNLSNFDTSGMSWAMGLFAECVSLESLDLSNLDLSSVETLDRLFENCSSLSSVVLPSSDNPNLYDTAHMFSGCSSLASLDLSSFGTSNVKDMYGMFEGCSSLISLDLSTWDTSKVERTVMMFNRCSSLRLVDLSSFDTSNVTAMGSMFEGCSSLKALDLSSFDTTNASFSTFMFRGCNSLREIATGARTLANIDLPVTVVNGHSDWLSKADDKWYTSEQISAERKSIADIYTKGDELSDDHGSASQAMYRLYNPNSGEHFYTSSEVERDSVAAAGWDYERIGWYAPTKSSTPVYRLYNPNLPGEHHYTMNAAERDMLVGLGWIFESKDYNEDGAAWYSDDAQGTPLYRQYNPNEYANNHNYTTDKAEHDHLIGLGWNDEGLAWYGVAM